MCYTKNVQGDKFMFFSKSKYCGFYQCPKITWLKKNKPEEFVPDKDALARMASGNEVGDLAMGLFGDYIDVTTYTDDKLDIAFGVTTKLYVMAFSPSFGLYCPINFIVFVPK